MLDEASLTYFYRHRIELDEPVVLASEFSPYQRVDLVRDGDGPADPVYLYLNGNRLYGSRRLNQHNLFVSILPNLIQPSRSERALVIGGGSLDSARYLAPRVGQLTVCEIDEAVTRLARVHLQDPRGGFPEGWTLAIDDGKHFLGAHRGEPFDVISVDVPVPTYLQTAMLHSESFFRLARERLSPAGIFSISLSGKYAKRRPRGGLLASSYLSNRVMAGLLRAFPHVAVVTAGDHSYAWASASDLGPATARASERMAAFIEETDTRRFFRPPELRFVPRDDVVAFASSFAPIGDADMQIVLRMSVRKLYSRFYEGD
jgi:spermidine synthase